MPLWLWSSVLLSQSAQWYNWKFHERWMWTCKSRISAGHYLLILFISFYNASTFYLQEQLMLLTDLHSSYRSHVRCLYIPPDWQHPSSTMNLFASFRWSVNPFVSRNLIRSWQMHTPCPQFWNSLIISRFGSVGRLEYQRIVKVIHLLSHREPI